MNQNHVRDLFHLQSELIDMKVDAAVSKTIDRVVEQMAALREDMHVGFRQIDANLTSLDKRMVAVETRLGIVGAIRKGFYDRIMDYLFKGSYAALYALVSFLAYLAYNFHSLIK